MSHFKFALLISISILFWACDEQTTAPITDIPKTNLLIGKWQEQLDTSTDAGKQEYKVRTFLGQPWIPDTSSFVNDSTNLSSNHPGIEQRYKIVADSILTWSPVAAYDTSRNRFEVKHDTLFFGDPALAGRPYYKKLL